MTEHDFTALRHAMVASQLRTTAVNDPRVVAAMDAVAREAFVPAGRAALAYVDTPVPLGGGRALNPPMATGRLLAAAALRPSDRVLLIGAASGYAAALLARLVADVIALEEDAALLAMARAALADVRGVTLVEAPLVGGHPGGAPYDVLVVDGAVAAVPAAIVAQLGEGARIVSGLVDKGVTRLCAGTRAGAGCGLIAFADAEAVVLPGFAAPPAFSF